MWRGGCLLGGEPGGNIIINDGHHTAADAVYTALVLGGVLVSSQGFSLREIVTPFQKRPLKTVSFKVSGKLTLWQRARLQARIRDIQTEWNADRSFQVRKANLTDGSGSLDWLNSDFFLLAGVTVFDDADANLLNSNSGEDWILISRKAVSCRQPRKVDERSAPCAARHRQHGAHLRTGTD